MSSKLKTGCSEWFPPACAIPKPMPVTASRIAAATIPTLDVSISPLLSDHGFGWYPFFGPINKYWTYQESFLNGEKRKGEQEEGHGRN
jgi:hypothetical protein